MLACCSVPAGLSWTWLLMLGLCCLCTSQRASRGRAGVMVARNTAAQPASAMCARGSAQGAAA